VNETEHQFHHSVGLVRHDVELQPESALV